jgi:hypothetical protein
MRSTRAADRSGLQPGIRLSDSRGFLWMYTTEGLSRFDGYEFTTYGTDQGLRRTTVYDLIETRSGDYWAATNGLSDAVSDRRAIRTEVDGGSIRR